MAKSYGIPMQGSKSRIADKIIDLLPSATHFYDLFGGASPNCGAGVRPYLIRHSAFAHKNPTRFSRGSMSRKGEGASA